MREFESPMLSIPVAARDHSQGPADAAVTLVEYGDYECPHCGRAYPIVKEVQRQLGSQLRFVFRNFPLARFDDDLTAHVHAARVREDFASGVRSGVNGTPTFFINGRRHDGPWDFESLMRRLERAVEPSRVYVS